nr:gypsy/Ty3 retroelement polyprotein [Tanacetum cinerariifolium]GEX15581.1 gypsy/Ty3 retroelement polyprotein [Tanacetum cinerariifolium]
QIKVALAAIQETLANIQAEVRTHTTEIANLKRGKGTSQPRTSELTSQPRTHPEPNTPYGKLIKIEFPKFSGGDHFEVEVVKRFGVLYDDPIVELKNLKQTGSVQTYQEDFEALLNRVDLPELVAVSHKCSGQLHSIEVICGDDFDNYIDGDDETYQDCVGDMVRVTDSPQITINALSGLNSYQTMRVRGRVGKQVVHILIDCGNTHNFLDIHTTKKLGCRLAKTTLMQVLVDNGKRMMSTYVCPDLKWSLQNEVFISDVMLLPLGGCEMMESVESVSAEVEQVLTQFDKVFEVPKDLPPQRSHDHQIPLMTNTPPINVRPYKHPPNQKDAIEVFFKLDLRSGYHQIRMKEDDICKTTFTNHEGHYKFLVMPFGLTNAPSTFQSPMNTVFKAFLRKFMLVSFDDILIYSKNLEEHCDHLAQVLQVMKNKTLYAKRTKCYFAVPQVEYLGHIISAQGVYTDPSKIKAMQKWPIPSTLKQLRWFLGLTGYYRRFIKDYASISQPLVALTKKDAFKWNPLTELAYRKLKEAMVKAPVLALPNFEQEFVISD